MCPFLWSLGYFVSILHASPRAHRSCLSVSSWDRPSNFGAYGLRSWGLVRWITPNTKRWTLAFPNFESDVVCFTRFARRELVSKLFVPFRKIELNFVGSMSWITQPNCREFFNMATAPSSRCFFSIFCWADLQAARARKHTDHRICIPDFFL